MENQLPSRNKEFAKAYMDMLCAHESYKEMKKICQRHMELAYDAFPIARIDAEKHFIKLLETHNEGA